MPTDKLKIRQAVIVEGKYDKIRLESLLDALIIPTNGFQIFSDPELRRFIKKLACERGVVIITDSDAAGFKIRSHLTGMIPKEQITNVYIPDVFGKERRKAAPSSEGKLGVEGMDSEILKRAFTLAGVGVSESAHAADPITRLDLYEDGLTGGANSRALRRALYGQLGLPERLNLNAALVMLNALMPREEYKNRIAAIQSSALNGAGRERHA